MVKVELKPKVQIITGEIRHLEQKLMPVAQEGTYTQIGSKIGILAKPSPKKNQHSFINAGKI